MTDTSSTAGVADFLATLHPYDRFPEEERDKVAQAMRVLDIPAKTLVYSLGDPLDGIYIVVEGEIEIRDSSAALVSLLGTRNSFGERGLLRDGAAMTTASTRSDSQLLLLPVDEFHRLRRELAVFAQFFQRGHATTQRGDETLGTTRIADLMTRGPAICAPGETVAKVARRMRERHVSSLPVLDDGALVGIVTKTDLTGRVLADGLSPETRVGDIMTRDPETLSPDDLGVDVLSALLERRIRHLPVMERGKLIGIVSQTDLIRRQSLTSGYLIEDIAWAKDPAEMAMSVARIPELLVQLVAGSTRHENVTRLITDIADAATRQLLRLAEESLGPPPVPYLWLACGSQGRQEQTGVSDQDNCLMLSDDAKPKHDAYFAALAKYVSDGLATCGYFYCPGDMMATNPRWRQKVKVWRDYFDGWIRKPDPMAQMLASVMFDLRPIGGDTALFSGLQSKTLKAASKNSIFVAHMVSNSLKHQPPLSLFRGFATIRSGEHKDTVDLKLNGVVPVVDLARIYTLQGRLRATNTLARIKAAAESGTISTTGAHDLIDAYDLIAETRLNHQARLIRSDEKPDNFMAPGALSDFERSHLRDAFVVVKTMQSALGHGRAALT